MYRQRVLCKHATNKLRTMLFAWHCRRCAFLSINNVLYVNIMWASYSGYLFPVSEVQNCAFYTIFIFVFLCHFQWLFVRPFLIAFVLYVPFISGFCHNNCSISLVMVVAVIAAFCFYSCARVMPFTLVFLRILSNMN